MTNGGGRLKFYVARLRLTNQHVAQPAFDKPGDVVRWLGAVQAQDYLGGLWAVGLRTRGATERDVEQAIADKAILRTWPVRGTLHFVVPEDARWMLKLLAARVIAGNARRLSQRYGLDDAEFARSRDVLIDALEGGRRLTRDGVYQAFEAAGIATANQRGLQILWRLAQEGLVCFGPRQDRQQTFALLDEWVPRGRVLEREEALAELARRYFTGHGPATLRDFVWWTGLTVADAKQALGSVRSDFAEESVDGETYWLSRATPPARPASPRALRAFLLPPFDEFMVGYTDRGAALSPADQRHARSGGFLLSPAMVIDGRVVGTWTRRIGKGAVVITPRPFAALTDSQVGRLAATAKRYGAFIGLTASLAGASLAGAEE
jgi:hypothetical protein